MDIPLTGSSLPPTASKLDHQPAASSIVVDHANLQVPLVRLQLRGPRVHRGVHGDENRSK